MSFSKDQIILFIESERQWYIADATGKSNSCSKLCDMPPRIPSCGTPVILGSYIYYLGGCFAKNSSNFYSSMVFVFDILNPEKGWIQGSSMGAVRLSPAVVSVAGKIYVFGGHVYNSFPVAEVFDPNSNSWNPLSIITPCRVDIMDNNLTILGVIDREILMRLCDKLYLYSVDTESFKLKDKNFTGCFQTTAVSADGNILCLYSSEGYVKGYDLVNYRWLSNSFKIDTAETNDRGHLVTPRDGDFGSVFSTVLNDGDGKMNVRGLVTLRDGDFGLVFSTALNDGDGKMNVMLLKFKLCQYQTQLHGTLGSSTSFVIEGVGLPSHVFAL